MGIEPKALYMSDKYSTTELYPEPQKLLLCAVNLKLLLSCVKSVYLLLSCWEKLFIIIYSHFTWVME